MTAAHRGDSENGIRIPFFRSSARFFPSFQRLSERACLPTMAAKRLGVEECTHVSRLLKAQPAVLQHAMFGSVLHAACVAHSPPAAVVMGNDWENTYCAIPPNCHNASNHHERTELSQWPIKQNTLHDKSLRRLALSLVTLLPDDHGDALKVVSYMRSLVEEFLDRKDLIDAARQVIAFVDSSN
jgi:hypothetical protein